MVPGLGVKHRKEVILRVESKGIKFGSVEISFQSERQIRKSICKLLWARYALRKYKISPNVIKELNT